MQESHTCGNAPDDEDENDSEEEDLMLDGGDIENDSDADLDALLEDANRLVGRPSTGRKRAKTGKGRHVSRGNMDEDIEDEEEEEQDVMYEEFWGSSDAKQSRDGRKGRKQGKKNACLHHHHSALVLEHDDITNIGQCNSA